MQSNMHAIHRRANFVRSQTINSAGPVPVDGEKTLRSNSSASSSSSLLSTTSIGPLPNVICVQAPNSSHSLDSGLQMKICEKNEPIFVRASEFMEFCDDSQQMSAETLMRHEIDVIINISASNSVLSMPESTASVPNTSMPTEYFYPLDHTSTPKDIMAKFSGINKIITKAREMNEKILIYTSRTRKSLGFVVIVQYLMWYYNLDAEHAVAHWQRLYVSKETLSQNCMEALASWQSVMKTDNLAIKRSPFSNNQDSKAWPSRFQQILTGNLGCSEVDADAVE